MLALTWICATLLLLGCRPAAAHDVLEAASSSRLWSYDPWLLAPLYLVAICFYLGTRKLWRYAGFGRGVTFAQAAAFWSGWLVLALAVTSPLHWLGERLFSAHMVEHELLMLLAAPLMAFATINTAVLWSLPRRWRPAAGRLARAGVLSHAWRFISHPVSATTLHGVALWAWHAPPLYRLALQSVAVHRLQHFSFFLTALLFWWVLLHGSFARRNMRDGVAVGCLFITVLHCGLLGALLTLSTRLWAPQQDILAAEFGLTALEDQQFAGLLMWIPMGMVYTLAALLFAFRWIMGGRGVAAMAGDRAGENRVAALANP